MLVQIASGMTTELQNGWSAHTPVGDEQRTVTAELGAWDRGGGIGATKEVRLDCVEISRSQVGESVQ